MLIGIGVALFAILFAGGNNDLLLSQVDKYVKSEIQDKGRKEIIENESKAVSKLDKAYAKKTKTFTKELINLITDQDSKKEEFTVLFEEVVSYELESSESYIDHRMIVQETLTENEWNRMLEKASKDIKKSIKEDSGQLSDFEKGLTKSKEKILSAVPEGKKATAEDDLNIFKEEMLAFAEELLTNNQAEDEYLINQQASREDLKKVIELNNIKWLGLLNGFADLHSNLAKIVQESEWKTVASELRKLVKI